MPTGGDVEYTITYAVRQHTTATSDNQPKVIERFKRELALQFGSSCDVEVVITTPTPQRKRRTKKK